MWCLVRARAVQTAEVMEMDGYWGLRVSVCVRCLACGPRPLWLQSFNNRINLMEGEGQKC